MNDPTQDENEKQRRLDFLHEKLTPISVERARELLTERTHLATMSSYRQLTIPASIRHKLRLEPGDRLRFTVRGDSTAVLEVVKREP